MAGAKQIVFQDYFGVTFDLIDHLLLPQLPQ